MYTKHNYFDDENLLISERYFVYQSAPTGAPASAPKPAAGPEKVEAGKQQPEQKETPEQLAKRALDTIDWIDGMRDKLKDPKYKDLKQFGDLEKRLGTIQDRLKTILENNTDKKAEVRENVLKMLDDTLKIYQEANKATKGKIDVPEPQQAPKVAPAQAPKSVPANAPKPVEKQGKNPEGKKETVPTEPKEKLSYLLGKVMEGGRGSFDQNKNEITKLIESLDIKPGAENQAASVDLPGGFTLGHVNWPKTAGKNPNFAIFKDGETVCYMQDNGGAKMELTHARELGQNERPDFGRRVAELIKCNVMLPKALSQIKEHPTGKNIIFANPTALNEFKASLMTMAKMSQTDKPSWEANYGGKTVQFNRKSPTDGIFKIQVNGKMMYFDTTMPTSIGLEQPAEKGGKEVSYWDSGDFLLTPQEQIKSDRRESILKSRETVQKKDEEQAKKQLEEKQKQEQEAKLKEEQVKTKVSDLVSQDFKNLVVQNDKDPKSITVSAKADDKKGLELINKSEIGKLLNLDQIKTEMVSVKINAPGKPERVGLYYPGQKTVYEVDKTTGKQTNNRIKFYNGDTLSFEFKQPEKGDETKLNSDKNAENSVDRIEARATFDKFATAVKKFVEGAKGKIEDLDLKSLNKFKESNKNYDPSKILTEGHWTKENVKSFKIEEVIAIIKEETRIINEAIAKKPVVAPTQAPASGPAAAPAQVSVPAAAPAAPAAGPKAAPAPAPSPKATPKPAPAAPQATTPAAPQSYSNPQMDPNNPFYKSIDES